MPLFVSRFYILVIFVLVWVQWLIFRTLEPELQSQAEAPFFTRAKAGAVWTSSLSMSHGNLPMAVFYSHPQRPSY